MTEHKTMIFVVAVLYSLHEKWRGIGTSRSFENILSGNFGVNLHTAWYQLHNEGLLGEFSKMFHFDRFYGTSNLHEILSVARQSLLIRLDGSDFAYHLDEASPRVIRFLMQRHQIQPEQVRQIAERLNVLLEEQAIKALSPAP